MKTSLRNALRKVTGVATLGALSLYSVNPALAQLSMDTLTADVETVNTGMLVVVSIIIVCALLGALVLCANRQFVAGAATIVVAIIVSGLIATVAA